jgi:hypothetical protein
MRFRAWVAVCALVAAVPAVGFGRKPPPVAVVRQPGPAPAQPPDDAYKAPKADGPVVELLDEGIDPLIPLFTNDGTGEGGTFTREDRDVFAGVEAARVTPVQRYRSNVPGWAFKIVEEPKKAGEFRHLRFAWKKVGGSGITIHLHDPARVWGFRYHAGNNLYDWKPSLPVADKMPAAWEVVTRDLFKDHGAFTLDGIALAPLDGGSGLFDHVLLGRTVADLDAATAAALGRAADAPVLAGAAREAAWADLMGDDRVRAAAAQRALLAGAADHVAFVADRLGKLAIDKDQLARVRKLLADLDADDFDVRDRATDDLAGLGAAAYAGVRALAAAAPNDEVRYRANLIVRRMNLTGVPVSSAGRLARAVRLLERADTGAARALLGKMEAGEYGFDTAADARAALARLKKP